MSRAALSFLVLRVFVVVHTGRPQLSRLDGITMSVVEPLVRPSSFTVPSELDANIPTGLLVQPFAALPPGSMTGQCWLKHQEDPNNPQVNMRGDYSEAYLKRHTDAPKSVQWSAGVVVRKGSKVDLSTWSSRANW